MQRVAGSNPVGSTICNNMKYNFAEIEKQSQKLWQEKKVFEIKPDSKKEKFYVLDMFPYPSGDGLHVGHVKGYTATDIIAHYKRLCGYNVLHPMGWDAFGLPAENYAIKVKKNPKDVVKNNVAKFKNQLQSIGFSYDWSREINTTDPEYYKWTQWIFLKLFEKGLAYQDEIPINFCPSCKTGLANEEVVSGECERCGTKVEKKNLRQWILKITKYADRLLEDLSNLDWPEPIVEMQKNWIGRSEGSEIVFKLNVGDELRVFTTRADTLFGCTYVVVAPEHEIIEKYKDQIKNFSAVASYISSVKNKSELERTDLAKEKTGVKIEGITATNPINGAQVPIYVADYVLGHYGTGAVMAVPAHDDRDFEFAKKYGLPIVYVIEPRFEDKHGDSAVKPDEEFVRRDAVCAIVRNPKNNKYLCISWKSHKMHGLVTGGIDEGEDPIASAEREITEETGYKNLKYIRTEKQSINALFYHRVKRVNRWAHFTFVTFDLIDEDKLEIEEEEADLHEVVWKKQEELKDFFTVIEGKFVAELITSGEKAFTEYGLLANSGKFNQLGSEEAITKITETLAKSSSGSMTTNYKLRDWIFSRQRYWGEPIPIIHCQKCGIVPVPEQQLPVVLPEIENYEPAGDGTSPLSRIDEWVNTKCPKCGSSAKRETNTMPQWAGSCWYYLRFADPNNKNALISKDIDRYFLPVDFYVGGAEHAVLHLLYARFWHKLLFDIGVVKDKEPFKKLKNVGLILAPDRQKMSKSRGNVINPDDMIREYGADALRTYEMFIGPFDQPAVWSKNGIVGTYKFLEKLYLSFAPQEKDDSKIGLSLNELVRKITEKIEKGLFNTAISDFMKFCNQNNLKTMSESQWKKFLIIISPFAPHLAENLFGLIEKGATIFDQSWPEIDDTARQTVNLVVQINGKKKAVLEIPADLEKNEVLGRIYKVEKLKEQLNGVEFSKMIFVKDRLVNFVI